MGGEGGSGVSGLGMGVGDGAMVLGRVGGVIERSGGYKMRRWVGLRDRRSMTLMLYCITTTFVFSVLVLHHVLLYMVCE